MSRGASRNRPLCKCGCVASAHRPPPANACKLCKCTFYVPAAAFPPRQAPKTPARVRRRRVDRG